MKSCTHGIKPAPGSAETKASCLVTVLGAALPAFHISHFSEGTGNLSLCDTGWEYRSGLLSPILVPLTPLTPSPSTLPHTAGCKRISTSFFLRQGMKLLTSQLFLLCVFNSCFLAKAGWCSGQLGEKNPAKPTPLRSLFLQDARALRLAVSRMD